MSFARTGSLCCMFGDTKALGGLAVDGGAAAQRSYGVTRGIRTSEEYGLLTRPAVAWLRHPARSVLSLVQER
jgi:hypothetical protein